MCLTSSSAVVAANSAELRNLVRLAVQKQKGTRLGATIVIPGQQSGSPIGKTVVIAAVADTGLIAEWNQHNPGKAVSVGDEIVEVNGHETSWAIMDQLASFGSMNIVVNRKPRDQDVIELLGSDEEVSKRGAAPCRVAMQHKKISDGTHKNLELCWLPSARAGDVGVDQCAICMEEVAADEGVALLGCGHGFHQSCMCQWIQQGKRHVCPLCIRDVFD